MAERELLSPKIHDSDCWDLLLHPAQTSQLFLGTLNSKFPFCVMEKLAFFASSLVPILSLKLFSVFCVSDKKLVAKSLVLMS
jgi:hypothetical protein